MQSGSSAATDAGPDVQERLLDAAEESFARFGLAKTTMDDVARHAGMSRATVYRYFKSRDQLLMAVVEREARRTASEIKQRLCTIHDPGEYIVEGIVHSLAEIPRRSALSMIFSPDAVGMTSRLVVTSERLAKIALELVLPVIEPARAKGMLRENVDTDVMVEWIIRLLTSYLTVPSASENSEAEIRKTFRSMLLPALLK